MSKTFMYFAYGSNMLSKRIHINNPTAVQKHIGILKDHRLDFIFESNGWCGAASTIVPELKSEVWGVVWEIDMCNMPDLDNQEGVKENIYFAKTVSIKVPSGEEIECRTYQQTKLPNEYVEPNKLPLDRQPSLVYLNTLIKGAQEFKIPHNYIEYLKSFHHNNYCGEVGVPDMHKHVMS